MKVFSYFLLILLLSLTYSVIAQADSQIELKDYLQFNKFREVGVNQVEDISPKSVRPSNSASPEATILIVSDENISKKLKYGFLYLMNVRKEDLLPIGEEYYQIANVSKVCQCVQLNKNPIVKKEFPPINAASILIPLVNLKEYPENYFTSEVWTDRTFSLRTEDILVGKNPTQNKAKISFWGKNSRKIQTTVIKVGSKVKLGNKAFRVTSITAPNYELGVLGWVTLSD